jgi:hypothetical protein
MRVVASGEVAKIEDDGAGNAVLLVATGMSQISGYQG